ncbi:putative NADH-flavin reductase [Dysgonomonas sp. PFB1-18]|uniref:NAD(P)-dependent oxidoreductase n=1 Tax=unclassified Dysgonomonas TaxID=2630389 RepID=UPI002476AF20|nr:MULTISPECIES: NAD(P)H-binding protein [unclassified Dysgonomonas]MDH6308191.1 putative NADH-flavin reductase [Dysgonomonas sp. PF1-14]MDH6338370.1 putative NADH-flavin reductase [Dysgonomonas sp. PF1-16]MDH6379867.1 putative NADH-flavin reductase [Dysgonomonas sp. PFB1-18]MDH6397043.1 putative NADH-flavin reductase [Dysgonomonas sp. PF1-23]
MKVALIGATGFVGSHLLQELLSRNYEVTALARSVEKIPVKDGKPKVVAVDVTDTKALAEVIKGNDVVLSAFNAGWSNPNIYDDFMKGSEAIQQAVKEAGVKRYVVIGGAGSLYINGKQIVDGEDFPESIKPGATAARDYLDVLKKETVLDWTMFSPAINMHQGIKIGRTGKYRTGTDEPVFGADGESTLSVEDLAIAVVDELENHKFSRQRFTAGY